MKKILMILVALGFLSVGVRPLLAHHSFSAEFDDKQPLKLNGKLVKVEWMNPHIWFYVEVKNADGSITTWALSGGAPGQLQRRGVTKSLLVIGSTVNVEGFRAKDGSNNGSGGHVTFADGRKVFAGSAEDVVPK